MEPTKLSLIEFDEADWVRTSTFRLDTQNEAIVTSSKTLNAYRRH